jgi:hypothetical protein
MFQPNANDATGPSCRWSVWRVWIVLTAAYIPLIFLLIILGASPNERSHYAISYVIVVIGMFVPSVDGAVAGFFAGHWLGIFALPALFVIMVNAERWASRRRFSCKNRLFYNLGVLLVATLVVDVLSSYQWTSFLTLLTHDPLRGAY